MLLGFISYHVYINSNFLTTVDITVLEFFHSIQSKTNDLFFSTITWLGSLWIIAPLFLITLFTLLKNGMFHIIFPVFTAFLGTILSTYGLKYLFERKRPELYETIGDLPFDPSFPSAHTSQAFIFIMLIVLILFHLQIQQRYLLSIGLLIIGSLVAISRIYLQVHYLSDIAAGVVIALIWTSISYYLLYNLG